MSEANLKEVYNRVAMGLKAIPGVTAVGIGGAGDIVVFVSQLTPQVQSQIPKSVEGVPVRIKVSGPIKLLSQILVPPSQILIPSRATSRTTRLRPAPGGVSIGHPLVTAGTFTCAVDESGKKVGLSNNHVIGVNWGTMRQGKVGDPILQPGVYDGGTIADRIGGLEKWIDVNPLPSLNTIDAAIFTPDNEADLTDTVLDLGKVGREIEPAIGMDIAKSGRTCGVKYGKVTATGVVVDVQGATGWGTCRFVDQIIIEPAILLPGDSGSWICDASLSTVGLGFAGSDTLSVANRASNVESLLGIKFLAATAPSSSTLLALSLALLGGFGAYAAGRYVV